MRFPPTRYCQISSAIAETALYSRFGGHNGGVVKGEKRKYRSSIWFSWPTKVILPANQGDLQGNQKGPCVQAHAFATITMYSWWRFGEPAYRSEIYFFWLLWRDSNSLRASDFAWLPPTALLALLIIRRTPSVLLGKIELVSDGSTCLKKRPYQNQTIVRGFAYIP